MSNYTRYPDPASGIKIYPSVIDFPLSAQDGAQAVAADTNTIYIYDTSVPGWQPVANPGAAIAIDGLQADVSATGPGVVNATVNSVGGAAAADIATATSDVLAATELATPNTLVKRGNTGNANFENVIGNTSLQAIDGVTPKYAILSKDNLQITSTPDNRIITLDVTNNSINIQDTFTADVTQLTTTTISASNSFSEYAAMSAGFLTLKKDTMTNDGIVIDTINSGLTNFTGFNPAASNYVFNFISSNTYPAQLKTNWLTLKDNMATEVTIVPVNGTSSYSIALPPSQGAASSVLQNDGLGGLSWVNLVTGVSAVTASAPLSSSGGATPDISISQSSAMSDGYLSSADWSTFNSKVDSVSGSAPISSSGGTSPTVSISQSGAASDGYLSSADWSTFNSKQPAGNYITDLTGEVTATGPGSVAATIAANAVTNAKLAKMAANTIKGNNTAGPSDPLDLSVAQTTAMLNAFVGDSGAGGTKGMVPAPAIGDSSKYLKGDGSWSAVTTLPAYSIDKVLYSTASAAEWRTVGTGSSDSAYPSNSLILGKGKPAGFTSQQSIILGTGTTGDVSTGLNNILIGYNSAPALATGAGSIAIGSSSVIGAAISNGLAIGTSANCSGVASIAIGASASTGSGADTLVIGNSAGNSASTGATNLIIGSSAATSLTNGYRNVVVGRGVGAAMTTGYENVLIGGIGTGAATTTAAALTNGLQNVIIGQSAGYDVIGPAFCVLVGVSARTTNTSPDSATGIGMGVKVGDKSVAIGRNCATGTGINNVAIGYEAGSTVGPTGSDNIFIGSNAGDVVTSAASSVIVGKSAGAALTSGSSNTLVGKDAGTTISTGASNVVVGASGSAGAAVNNQVVVGASASSTVAQGTAVGSSATASGAISTAIGYTAQATQVGSLALGNDAASVSQFGIAIGASAKTGTGSSCIVIGTSAGRAASSGSDNFIAGTNAGYALTNGNSNILVGTNAGAAMTTGSGNIVLGVNAGDAIQGGNNNVLVGKDAGGLLSSGSTNLLLGNTAGDAITTGSNNTILGDIAGTAALSDTVIVAAGTAERFRVDSSGNMGIGTTSPTARLDVSGDSSLNGALVVNEAGADKDMRVEGDTDVNLLFTDASADKVGIGTNTPAEKLDIGTGNARVSNGDLILNTAGNGLKIKTGTDATAGIQTGLSGVTATTINTAKALTGSLIFVQPINTTDKHGFSVSAINNGVSFTVDFSGTYTGDLAWFIINPA